MIKLIVNDYCQNCPEFEACVEKETIDARGWFDDLPNSTNTTITCEHNDRCRHIKNMIVKEKETVK